MKTQLVICTILSDNRHFPFPQAFAILPVDKFPGQFVSSSFRD